MAHRDFTDEERAYLESLPAVAGVSGGMIRYTDEFRDSCMERYLSGDSPVRIFREAGLEPELIGHKRIERCIARWRPRDISEGAGDRNCDLAKQNQLMKTRIAVLEELVELAEARSSRVVSKAKRFALIERLRDELAGFSISEACHALGVSVAGYYHWRSTQAKQAEEA